MSWPRHAALERTGRTYVWTAPLRPGAVRPWTATAFEAAFAGATRQLAEDDSAFTSAGPVGRIADELVRAEAARGRLLLIGSLAVAILLAFAVFAALVGRADIAAEVARLRPLGARRRDVASFLLFEALLPVAAGGLLGWPVGLAVTGALGAWLGAPVGPLLVDTLVAPGPLLAAGAILLLAVVCDHGGQRSAGVAIRRGPLGGTVAVTVLVVLGWQLIGVGALEPTALGRSLGNPAIVALPPALAFVVALAFLAVLPPASALLARRFERAPLAVRLSILSVSRDPVRPAATLTLLAFSLGAIVFATGWSASLSQGIEDQAAYRSGQDLRVVELGNGPVGRANRWSRSRATTASAAT